MFDINVYVENIRKRNLNENMGNREWTKAVLETLLDMGLIQGFEVYPNRKQEESEVLLDCVWYDVQKKPYKYKKMILGAESEWSNYQGKSQNKEDILEDFYKLLDFKCDYKIMIYSTYKFGDEYVQDIRNEMLRILKDYERHIQRERYIFFDFQDDEKTIEAFQIKIKNNGMNPDLEIENVGKFIDCWT